MLAEYDASIEVVESLAMEVFSAGKDLILGDGSTAAGAISSLFFVELSIRAG